MKRPQSLTEYLTLSDKDKMRLLEEPTPKPCPFCGYANVEVRPHDAGVYCRKCGAWMPSVASSDPRRAHGALEMWNTRA